MTQPKTLAELAQEIQDSQNTATAAKSLPAAADTTTPAPQSGFVAIIQYLLDHPATTINDITRHFHRSRGWFMLVLASTRFQLLLDPHRHLIQDPDIFSTVEERFRALSLRAADVLQTKMEKPDVADLTVVKAAEIGIKALGLGQLKASEGTGPASVATVEDLAARLVSELQKQRTNLRQPIDVTPTEIQDV